MYLTENEACKPRIHSRTIIQIYLFLSTLSKLNRWKKCKILNKREKLGSTFSDKDSQLWDSLQSRFPNGPHSQAASLCHTEVPASMENNIRISLIHFALTAYDSAKIMHTNLVSLRCKLKVGSFNNGIDRACLLAESTIDTLCHVNIIPSCPTATIFSLLCFNGDCLCRTYLINGNSLVRLKCRINNLVRLKFHTQRPSHINSRLYQPDYIRNTSLRKI